MKQEKLRKIAKQYTQERLAATGITTLYKEDMYDVHNLTENALSVLQWLNEDYHIIPKSKPSN